MNTIYKESKYIHIMPIIVNLDVMMARRKISLGDLAAKDRPHTGQSVHPENRKGQGRAVLHFRSHMQRSRLPAGRHSGVQERGETRSVNTPL